MKFTKIQNQHLQDMINLTVRIADEEVLYQKRKEELSVRRDLCQQYLEATIDHEDKDQLRDLSTAKRLVTAFHSLRHNLHNLVDIQEPGRNTKPFEIRMAKDRVKRTKQHAINLASVIGYNQGEEK